MIYDLVSSLKLIGIPDELAVANHVLKDGLYILLDEHGEGYKELLIEKSGEYVGELYESIRARDFYSTLIEMNKPVDGKKKIHSNNIYSFAFKYFDPQKASKDEEKKNPVNIYSSNNMEEHINRYFEALENWYDENREILEKTPIIPVNKNESEMNKKIFFSNIPAVAELVGKYKLKHGKYIKLFINEPIFKYKDASNLYLFPKIFNNNDFNVEIEGKIFGLSNANMGLNAKKPFLSHKTTQYGVPYRILFSEALDAYRLLMWLDSQNDQGKPQNQGYLPQEKSDNYYLLDRITGNTPAHYLHFLREKTGVAIDDYEILPYAQKDLDKPFKPTNYLNLPEYDNQVIIEMRQFESLVDEVLFNYYLVKSYYYDPTPVKKYPLSTRQTALIQFSKNAFLSYFRKSDKTALRKLIDKVSIEMILEKLKYYDYKKVEETYFAKALNLRFALLEYFDIGGKIKLGSKVMSLYEDLKTRILEDKPEKPADCESSDLFYFAVGQLARYLVGLSKAQRINYSFIDPILKAKNSSKIKREIITLIKKYGYDIDLLDKRYRSRFDNLQSIVNSYEGGSQENRTDLILAGFAAPNLIYLKKE